MSEIKHPAKFSDKVLEAVVELLFEVQPPAVANLLAGVPRRLLARTILDPFAGVGKIHRLRDYGFETTGVELEPEWANQSEHTIVGNALFLPFDDASFDAIVTSPCYGNRMADHHEAKDGSPRHTYRHYLGRPLHPDNSGAMQWGKQYRAFHRRAWAEATRVLKPGGLFILNVSDHIRKGQRVRVTRWHIKTLKRLGYVVEERIRVHTPRQKHGENADARVEYESVVRLRLAE